MRHNTRYEAYKNRLQSKYIKIFTKDGYNANEPSKLGKLPSKDSNRQEHEVLGYKPPPPISISIRRAGSDYITIEKESTTSNKRPSIFDRLGVSTTRTFIFKRLGPLSTKKRSKCQRSCINTTVYSLPRI